MRQRGPLTRRNVVIVERWVAGDSVTELAWDYGLSRQQIAAILVSHWVGRDRPRYLARALSRSPLRTCMQALLVTKGEGL